MKKDDSVTSYEMFHSRYNSLLNDTYLVYPPFFTFII